ncbi:metallophosphoesterase [Caldiplasma sukawensis]
MREIEVEDQVFATDLYCFYLADINAAVISDLHLGFEEEMGLKGLTLPKLQRNHVEGIVDRIIERYEPAKIIINGDFKQEFSKNLPQEWEDVKHFIDNFRTKTELVFIRGNHDNYLQSILSSRDIVQLDYYEDSRYFIYHGDRDLKLRKITLLGHEHPAMVLRDRVGGVYKIPAFVYNQKEHVGITPAMSFFSSGTDVSESLIGEDHFTPVLKRVKKENFRVFGITDDFGLVDFGNLLDLQNQNRKDTHQSHPFYQKTQ